MLGTHVRVHTHTHAVSPVSMQSVLADWFKLLPDREHTQGTSINKHTCTHTYTHKQNMDSLTAISFTEEGSGIRREYQNLNFIAHHH